MAWVAPVVQAVGAIAGGKSASGARKVAQGRRTEAANALKFQPLNSRSLFGKFDASLGDMGEVVLDPSIARLVEQSIANASNFQEQASLFNPTDFAGEAYKRMTNLVQPGIDTERARLESRLFSQGRLGVDSGGFGNPEQVAFETAAANDRQNRALSSIDLASRTQAGLLQNAAAALNPASFGQQVEQSIYGTALSKGETLFNQQLSRINAEKKILFVQDKRGVKSSLDVWDVEDLVR